mgnify:CR=1 FL=1
MIRRICAAWRRLIGDEPNTPPPPDQILWVRFIGVDYRNSVVDVRVEPEWYRGKWWRWGHSRAENIARHGLQWENVRIPAHRITEIEIKEAQQ